MRELNEFITDNYDKLKVISQTITGSKHLTLITTDADDLLHETIEVLYKLDHEKVKKLINKKKFIFYIVRIMINQFHSNTSPYFYKYKKYYKLINPNYNTSILWSEHWLNSIPEDDVDHIKVKEEFEDMLYKVQKNLKKLNWFDAEIFKVYYLMGHSLNTLAKETGINRSTIYKSIQKVIKKLKENE